MALAAPTQLDLNTTEGIKSYIRIESLRQGVQPEVVEHVVKCESSFRGDVYGDSGNAYGLAQFWPETFERLSKKAGVQETADRGDYRAQITTLVWAIANGYGNEWTCYRNR